ncbi:MAG: hypothetical protein NT069_05235 [Planctomycetota bacterium]|nr:hypothetical protein [Planctomycetota bacterium]
MQIEHSASGNCSDGFAMDCSLEELKARSQADFEIEFFEWILHRDPNQSQVLRCLGDLFAEKGLHRRALRVDMKLAELHPYRPAVFYNLACSYAVLGHELAALESLERAVELGFSDGDYMLIDPDLSSVRQNPRFRRLASRLKVAAGATVV